MPQILGATQKKRGRWECLLIGLLVTFAGVRYGQAQSAPNGPQLFSANCAACHGLDGRGGEHAPNIATDAAVQQKTDNELTSIVRKGIPAAGMPGFAKLFDGSQIAAVLHYLRNLQKNEDQGTARGDAERGRAIFFGAGRCADCHTMSGRGGFLGADLTGYGETHSASAIRDWILDPDKNADVRHGTVAVLTRQGERYRGVARNEDNFSLQMQTPDGRFHLFDKADLVRVEHEPRSIMPDDYGKALTAGQLDDVISFLAKAKGVSAKTAEADDDQ